MSTPLDALGLMAADVVELETENYRLAVENRTLKTMLSEALDIAHQAVVYIHSAKSDGK